MLVAGIIGLGFSGGIGVRASTADEAGLASVSYAPSPEKRDEDLTGKDIYERVLENRFSSYIQASSLRSGDRAGNTQLTRLRMWFKNFEDKSREPAPRDLLSKTLVKYTHPFELRHSGYLVINNIDRPNDQFVYLSSHRRVKRVNLRGEAVFGTDFSFEDVIPKEIEDATYARLEDQEVEGVPCFVVEAIPKKELDSEYSRFHIFVEKARYVPLMTRYWDDRELQIKELRVFHDSIQKIQDVWIPMHMVMRNLRYESFTDLVVEEIEPNPKLDRRTFDLRRLEAH